ncbi:uncharacterized protein EAE97_002479 [Botrytis byssoidea]|uniref:Heterokaryon incompatibility domain-containing protein n=1 Tax=Botrytis byssoidea TaxID=139641 RepID=A0A9P5LXQ7_9HELO|nr:uncharacterized protein EAE97_002479 [Botrytis byssoidea]KAF7950927.1 hypothetical protein EAE97_002479 [Botrytis byssoidea]
MRLLDTKDTENLRVQKFSQRNIPSHAILSHRWEEEEVTFEDIKIGNFNQKKGFAKLKECRRRAREDKYDWVWVDTCCIDKSSSAELSEAINSMYRWYQDSAVCYAYLSDLEEIGSLDKSKWFSRGWTLQELIAPRHVLLFDMHWRLLGTKDEHAAAIERITGILRDVILGNVYPGYCNAAQRISWASKRETTREEDMAYCLMGLFNIHMLPMYGEGSENAFLRLQQEILKRNSDQTLFLWTAAHEPYNQGLLATSPSAFCTHDDCFSWLPLSSRSDSWIPYTSLLPSNHTPRTLQYDEQNTRYINGPLIDVQSSFGSNGLQLPLLLNDNSHVSLSVNGTLPHSPIIICLDILTWHNDRIFLTLMPEHPPSPYTSRMSIDRMGAFRRPASTTLESRPRINMPLSMERQTITVSQVDTSKSGSPGKFIFSPILPSGIRFSKAFIFQSDTSSSHLNSFSEPFECVGGVVLFNISPQHCNHEQVMLAFGTRQRLSPSWCTLVGSHQKFSDSEIKHLYPEKNALNSRLNSRSYLSLCGTVHYAYINVLHDVHTIHLDS